ncbi:MAG: hypothetical protein LBD99_07580, partial [Candidatus Margulisbacteria bacterium]|nr:hypothetical protein [Candidatus Margulisiibacteriota bacterium]
YFEQGIGALVAETVDAEFNKISFRMSNDRIRKGYNVILTRTANNQYILEYEGIYQGKNFYEKLLPASLEALSSEMRRNTADFDQSCIDTVNAQAALIPAAVLGTRSMDDIRTILTTFYTSPNAGTYSAVKDVYFLYANRSYGDSNDSNKLFRNISNSYYATLLALTTPLAHKVIEERNVVTALTREQQQRLIGLRE